MLRAVRRLVADRHSAEARTFYEAVARIAHARLGDQDETLAAVVLELMSGGLATFRGATLPDLVAHLQATVDQAAKRDSIAAEHTSPALVSDLERALDVEPAARGRSRVAIQLRGVRLALSAPRGVADDARPKGAKVARD